ncbi:MAG: hypothetical protein PHU75_12035 [Candidatus Nanopelagicales bacterium]|nr:hypothetical protein [Candidatus Nanopelagicales bacterium]
MQLQIEPSDLEAPDVIAYLAAHLRDLEPTAPPESRCALDGCRRRASASGLLGSIPTVSS